jgi:hypothetical protein
MSFSCENFDCQVAMSRARENARIARRRYPPIPLDTPAEEVAEIVRDRIAVAWVGSRARYDEILAPLKGK